MKKKLLTSIGIMTGTSMDGVDLSLIKSDGDTKYVHIFDRYFEFDIELRKKLINLRNKIFSYNDLERNFEEFKSLERYFTLFLGKIIKKIISNYTEEIDLIGFHGQTVFHDAEGKISKQLGDGKLLSQITKKIVVNNFRENDLVNGGQGAPLAPLFHSLLTKNLCEKYQLEYPINIINIGGITNITRINSQNNSQGENLYAFDIGPGNCLIDEWVRKNSNNKFDKNGIFSNSGKVNDLILNQAIDNFEIKIFNKSLDIKDFDISFVKGLSLEDGCATLTKFSAILIAKGIDYMNSLKNNVPNKNLICGGGRKNLSLLNFINKSLIQKNNIEAIDNYGFDGDFIESQAFGYLSIRSFLELPITFPNTTRCKGPTTGGTINKNF